MVLGVHALPPFESDPRCSEGCTGALTRVRLRLYYTPNSCSRLLWWFDALGRSGPTVRVWPIPSCARASRRDLRFAALHETLPEPQRTASQLRDRMPQRRFRHVQVNRGTRSRPPLAHG